MCLAIPVRDTATSGARLESEDYERDEEVTAGVYGGSRASTARASTLLGGGPHTASAAAAAAAALAAAGGGGFGGGFGSVISQQLAVLQGLNLQGLALARGGSGDYDNADGSSEPSLYDRWADGAGSPVWGVQNKPRTEILNPVGEGGPVG